MKELTDERLADIKRRAAAAYLNIICACCSPTSRAGCTCACHICRDDVPNMIGEIIFLKARLDHREEVLKDAHSVLDDRKVPRLCPDDGAPMSLGGRIRTGLPRKYHADKAST